jgi:PAT family beta-lactamase induction signal transducer AmpG
MINTATTEKKSTWKVLKLALSNRKTGFMLLFGFASGLPFALFLGTLYAWLTEAEVELETMGVFSLIGLAYAFQFLWSPLIDKVNIKGFRRLGRRKQWIVPAQTLIGVILLLLSFSEPTNESIGWFSLLAGIGALASATQDIAINAWRIDNADEEATLDILSTIYQPCRASRRRIRFDHRCPDRLAANLYDNGRYSCRHRDYRPLGARQ